ncbi:alpha/beta hydrolase [Xylanimonas ulmi]|uniref:Alpha/beta hydrolase family protein n=1 Tax=Xylanimonas ulmi TaxID=228973 RepID=A0A4Q7M8C1_9MICO|nr:alpha/beta hydrolase [Xylanibacterium ulmi]RZS62948.1 alpha/beta hydrolase family protein [Xylanibacterium ulmi]
MRLPSVTAKTAVSGLTVLALAVLAGCSRASDEAVSPSPSPTGAASTVAPDMSGAPEGFEQYYGQAVDWSGCDNGFECATITAPLSWHDADGGAIDLALKRHPATGTRQGAVLVNPGGPGGSGVDYVTSAWQGLGERLRAAYDVVGFDPRGVGQSTPVRCFDDARKDLSLSKDFDDDDAGLAAMAAEFTAWADACGQNTGALLGNVDTQSAARDMDLIRAVLGEPKLDYLGFSYGTQLGATYAGLFPDRVGAMVLDGAIDITLDADQTSAQQAVGFEQALRNYVADCQGGADCPLTGDVDAGMRQIRGILDRALTDPYPTQTNRRVTQTLAFYGVAVTLYDQQSWPALTQALSEVVNRGTGNTLLYLADFYNDRNDDGTFENNSAEAFRAVGCLDSRGATDLAQMRAEAAAIDEAAPTVGRFFAYTGLVCSDWPYPVVAQEFDVHATGAPPIVVIGTTHDPATPYAWAQALAQTLDSGVLVTYEGEGHTAYGRSNQCVVDAVDAYFVDGTTPQDGLRC